MASHRIFVGTYTGKGSRGIYALDLDTATGALGEPALAGEAENPSFLALHPGGRFLYAVNEVGNFNGEDGGGVTAFSIETQGGKLTPLNARPTRGGAPCYVALDRAGRFAFVANYSGGSVLSYPIAADGRLGEAATFVQHRGRSVDAKRQEGPHAHSIGTSPDDRLVLACDLGLDQVVVYRLDPQAGGLTPHDPPFARAEPGSGPRVFAFSPDGRFVYVVNEMGGSVTAFAWQRDTGSMQALHSISTLPAGYTGRISCAEVQVHPTGRFVYASNRGHDSIAIFSAHEKTGRLAALGHVHTGGKEPRNFTIDPAGKWLIAANQNSDNLVVFAVDEATGALRHTGHEARIPTPVCVRFAV